MNNITDLSVGKRLQKAIHYTGLTQRQFAKEIGVTENYISLLISKTKRGISHSLACLIEQKYGISAGWLLRNEGDMVKIFSKNIHLDPVKQKLLSAIEKLTEKQAAAVLSFIETWEQMGNK